MEETQDYLVNEKNEEPAFVRRKVPKSDGLYVKGQVNGVKLMFTADTGATKTIISERVFRQIPEENRPVLQKSPSIAGACGKPLREFGKAKFKLKLADLELEKEVIIAEIEDEGLLGMDVLQQEEGGPADILLSKGLIHLNGVLIPCVQIGVPRKVRKVHAADNYVIPGMCEMVIDVFVDRYETDEQMDKNEVLIEPSETFKGDYPLIMAASLADLKSTVTQKVRIINPQVTEFAIRQDAIIGTAEPVKTLHTKFQLNPISGSGEEVENVNCLTDRQTDRKTERQTDGRRTTRHDISSLGLSAQVS